MKTQLNEIHKLQKIAGILKEEVYNDMPLTQKLKQECIDLGISWEEDLSIPYPIHVEDEQGNELWLRINDKTNTVDAVAQGYKRDIHLPNLDIESGEDIKDLLASLTDEWYEENDPDFRMNEYGKDSGSSLTDEQFTKSLVNSMQKHLPKDRWTISYEDNEIIVKNDFNEIAAYRLIGYGEY